MIGISVSNLYMDFYLHNARHLFILRIFKYLTSSFRLIMTILIYIWFLLEDFFFHAIYYS
jgi:hypothetical protein